MVLLVRKIESEWQLLRGNKNQGTYCRPQSSIVYSIVVWPNGEASKCAKLCYYTDHHTVCLKLLLWRSVQFVNVVMTV